VSDPDRVVVLDVVGLQPDHLSSGLAPNLAALVAARVAGLQPPFPAVTVPAQTTLATGQGPQAHGDVASGEYDRERDEVAFWERERSDRDRLWEAASDDAGLTTGVLFFQHLIDTTADVAVTPSPIEGEDNNILEMNCWTNPEGFYDDLEAELGHFPLHRYWGPGANEESSEWILASARESIERFDPDLLWVYVPHLDYDGLRHGPDAEETRESVGVVDDLLGEFLDWLESTPQWEQTALAVVSEYGFHAVDTPVFPNRALREAGLLETREEGGTDDGDDESDDGEGGTDVDLPNSDAFAMVDHQVAHVYAEEGATEAARAALEGLVGIDALLDEQGKDAWGIDHPNAGDLVLIADPSAWFQYYWWEEPGDAPPYATEMDIHKKPGFDPCELFFGEEGMVSMEPERVGGSHGRTDADGIFALGGPAAPEAPLPEVVDARAVAPTVADLLGIQDDVEMEFEDVSVLEL
jgi:predicted AlkP superfamily pyrophosphatase or phosphodiesterase